MSSGYATPIRLILDDDEKTAIRLDATRIGMSVERKVGGSPVPFTGGKRFGMDLNMSNSVIVIDGVFVDDTRDRPIVAATSAVAEIDFAIGKNEYFSFTVPSILTMTGAGFSQPITYTLRDKSGTIVITFSIEDFADNGTGGGVSLTPGTNAYLQVGGSSGTTWKIRGGDGAGNYATNANVAGSIQHLMANQSIGGAALTTKFTAALADSSNTSRAVNNNEKVVFTAATALAGEYGADGVIESPYRTAAARSLTTSFGTDASTTVRKSAGDKAQDLYGILHNTIRGGAAALSGSFATATGIGILTRLAGAAFTEQATLGDIGRSFLKSNDYPIGLQIPYNSTIQAADGQLYTARNFFVPTGDRKAEEKGSEANDLSADVEFSTTDNYTGIQGTVKNLEIGYDAGEAVYRYTLTFLPIDNIF
jgi:hypothetical protein